MSDNVRYAIHIRRLGQIKQRPNQYPTYEYNKKKGLNKSSSQVIIRELSSEIKLNKKNISSVKKSFEKKKPVNYYDDKYLFDREVEKIQKQMLDSLIKKNNKLKNQLKILKNSNSYIFEYPHKKKLK